LTPSAQTAGAGSPVAINPPWLFTSEHLEWRDKVRDFVDRELAPTVAERTVERHFADELIPRIGNEGFFGVRISEEYGGLGKDLTSQCIMLEEFARVDGSVCNIIEAGSVVGTLVEAMASAEQRREYLPRLARGESITAFGLTEPHGGSDAGNMQTRARRDGEDWVIDGAKDQISTLGSAVSEHVIVFAATGEGKSAERPAITAFMVPLDSSGITLGERYPKIGWVASDVRSVRLDGVRVPDSAVLGQPGRGYADALNLVTWARLAIASMATGVIQGCLDATLATVRERESFGRPVGEHQDAAFKVSRMVAKLAVARGLTYDGCYRFDHGHDYGRQASVAKLIAARLANEVAFDAVELAGAPGLIETSAVARLYGDARILTIGEGPEAVQKMLIARSLGLRG
jgi:alkylation response protein AidB-like acyl-CoA dehydrogenase